MSASQQQRAALQRQIWQIANDVRMHAIKSLIQSETYQMLSDPKISVVRV